MVYSQATGGLGNQLFNYAIGFALAQKNNDDFSIDTSAYKFSARPFMLDQLYISANIISLVPPLKNNLFFRMISRIFRIAFSNRYGRCKWIKESTCSRNQFNAYDFSYKHSIYLEGFWQNYRYFHDYYQLLLNEFAPSPNALSDECLKFIDRCRSCSSVAIHIRRGDYESSWLLDDSYYTKALSLINKKINNPHYMIFCEDKVYAKEHFSHLSNAIFVTEQSTFTDLEEFYLISACKHQIIANSTFSWWAAYLNDYAQKTVIAPIYMHWTREYYPDSWILIE